ncbi:hypothetical protein [Actinoplanes sp. NPDC026623]|uniref:AMIN-like domain-containing (lipo)protein n=1 Tax=Actinoplanes sp. NPDC026623 TaxID=3155610 RepID=UPI0033DBD581
METNFPRMIATVTALVVLAGCGGGGSPVPSTSAAGPAPGPAPAATAAPTRPVPGSGGAAAPVTRPAWNSGPVTVTHHPAVPPVPVLTGIRYAGHRADGYDRIVFDIEGPQAHRADGSTTVSGIHRTGLPTLKGYAITGDFEGRVSIALGLDDVVGYRVGELPGRIYLDVAA